MAAEVKDFDPKEYLEINDVLRTDRYAQFAVAAAQQAVDESGVEGTVEPERFAVIFGTGIGGIGTFETEHTKLMEKGPPPCFSAVCTYDDRQYGSRYDCHSATIAVALPCLLLRLALPVPMLSVKLCALFVTGMRMP